MAYFTKSLSEDGITVKKPTIENSGTSYHSYAAEQAQHEAQQMSQYYAERVAENMKRQAAIDEWRAEREALRAPHHMEQQGSKPPQPIANIARQQQQSVPVDMNEHTNENTNSNAVFQNENVNVNMMSQDKFDRLSREEILKTVQTANEQTVDLSESVNENVIERSQSPTDQPVAASSSRNAPTAATVIRDSRNHEILSRIYAALGAQPSSAGSTAKGLQAGE